MLRTLILVLAVAVCTACVRGSAVETGPCDVEPALAAWAVSVLEDTDALVFGELHGNAESPAAFKRIVCATLASADSALVGLELPGSAVDAVRAQVDDAAASTAVTGSEFWARAHDGRTSVAMFDLVEWLVHLEAAGRIQLLGIDMRVTGREPFGATSGLHLRRALSPTGEDARKILVLTGRGHSAFHGDGGSISEDLALHGIATLSVELIPEGGFSWVCRFGHCGVSDAPRGGCSMGDGVPGAYEELDGHRRRAMLCLGPVTPSLPKVQ